MAFGSRPIIRHLPPRGHPVDEREHLGDGGVQLLGNHLVDLDRAVQRPRERRVGDDRHAVLLGDPPDLQRDVALALGDDDRRGTGSVVAAGRPRNASGW